MKIKLPSKLTRRLAALGGLCTLPLLAWWLASKPVIFHCHYFSKPDYRSCGAYNEQGTGITVLNPFRSRAPEAVAEAFLRAATKSECLPEMTRELCRFVAERPLPATGWRLVYRWNTGKDVRLYYRLNGGQLKDSFCVMAEVCLAQSGGQWRICGYGVSG